MKNYIIFGDSPFAERLAKYILFEKESKLLCFTQEDDFCSREYILDYPVIPISELCNTIDCEFEILIAMGYSQMNRIREKIFNTLIEYGFTIGSWISSNAIVYSEKIGAGTLILPNAMIGPNCEIGKCNFIAASAVLSHNNTVGDFNFFSTNVVLGGSAIVKNHCFLGLNCTIKSSIEIADYSLIGSAANVLNDTEVYSVMVGNPARKIERKSTEIKI